MRKKKMRGIESLKSRYGLLFSLPWIIGFLIFFAYPLLESFIFSFSDVSITGDGLKLSFEALENYRKILFADANFTGNLSKGIWSFVYSLPLIVVLSLILAIILNQKFKGRTFFRGLFFLPVIIANGIVIDLLFCVTSSDLTSAGVATSLSSSMVTPDKIIDYLGLSGEIADYVSTIISNIFDLLWNCGIQIVLFISGLQTIPDQMYEVSKVEGATSWEEFWYITFPMLSRVTLLVIILTMIELFTDTSNPVIAQAYSQAKGMYYGISSAMMWFYFVIVGIIIALVMLIYNRFCMKRWQ